MTGLRVTHVLYLAEKAGRRTFSGAENHVWQLLPALVRQGVDVELVVLAWHPGPSIRAGCRELEAAGVRVVVVDRGRFRGRVGKLAASIVCWARCFALLRRRRDRLVHVHLDEIFVPVVARLAGCRQVVFTFHSDEPRYRQRAWRAWFVIASRLVRRFVAITDHVRRYCVEHLSLPASRIRVAYYGIELRDSRRWQRSDFGVRDDEWVVGFVGRFVPVKNLPMLIEAMAQMPEATAVLVGGGDLEDELRELVARRRLTNVRLFGPVEDGAAVMPTFDVLCLPSLWEGLGLVLVEAMLAGVPIVATRAGAIPEVLGQGAYGLLCESGSPDDLVAALRRCRTEREATKARVAAAREFARQRFSIDQMVAATCAVYGEAFAGG